MQEEFTLKDVYSELEIEGSKSLGSPTGLYTFTKELKINIVMHQIWRIDRLSRELLKEDWDTESLIEVIEDLTQAINGEEDDK